MSDSEKYLTEAMLDIFYADNGCVFRTEKEAVKFLNQQGFEYFAGIFKNRYGQKARIYRLRDAIMDTNFGGVRAYVSKGFLASMGGEPVSCLDLKYTKIMRGISSNTQ